MQKEIELLKGRLDTEKKHFLGQLLLAIVVHNCKSSTENIGLFVSIDSQAEVDKLRSQLETVSDEMLRCRKGKYVFVCMYE